MESDFGIFWISMGDPCDYICGKFPPLFIGFFRTLPQKIKVVNSPFTEALFLGGALKIMTPTLAADDGSLTSSPLHFYKVR